MFAFKIFLMTGYTKLLNKIYSKKLLSTPYLINTMYSLSNELILGVFLVVLYITTGNKRITSILSLHSFKEILNQNGTSP